MNLYVKDSPPVPSPLVKSPPWHMNPGIIRWKTQPMKFSLFPDLPLPCSPVQSALKFSAVLGTTCAKSSKTILPLDLSIRWDDGVTWGHQESYAPPFNHMACHCSARWCQPHHSTHEMSLFVSTHLRLIYSAQKCC